MIVDVHEAKTHLARLLERVGAGGRIVLGRNGQPVARLIPYMPESEPRRPGALQGRIHFAADFDETPEELIQAFEGTASE